MNLRAHDHALSACRAGRSVSPRNWVRRACGGGRSLYAHDHRLLTCPAIRIEEALILDVVVCIDAILLRVIAGDRDRRPVGRRGEERIDRDCHQIAPVPVWLDDAYQPAPSADHPIRPFRGFRSTSSSRRPRVRNASCTWLISLTCCLYK